MDQPGIVKRCAVQVQAVDKGAHPDVEVPVPQNGGGVVPVGGNADPSAAVKTDVLGKLPAGNDVPYTGGSIQGSGNQTLSVGAPGQVVHLAGMPP